MYVKDVSPSTLIFLMRRVLIPIVFILVSLQCFLTEEVDTAALLCVKTMIILNILFILSKRQYRS